MPEALEDRLFLEGKLFKDVGSGMNSIQVPSASFVFPFFFSLRTPFDKARFDKFPFAEAFHDKVRRKSVNRLCTHPIEAHRKLKNIIIVFGACVDLTHAFDNFAERNPASPVSH